jgi:NAD-dependent deacetylase
VSVVALADLIRERSPCVVLTGAGMSTESGIPDFRSPTGLWATVDPFEVASIEAFRRDPERTWRFYGPRIVALREARPNAGHHALAALEQAGLVRAVVTQNIDLLHSRAGSRDVIEVHGSIRSASCPRCRLEVSLEHVPVALAEGEAPRCDDCGRVLEPGVVMFGELLPERAIDRATALAREAPLLLVVGSSLQVWPVAGLPDDTLRGGGALVILNREATPYDARADLTLATPAAETLVAVERLLLG